MVQLSVVVQLVKLHVVVEQVLLDVLHGVHVVDDDLHFFDFLRDDEQCDILQ